MSVGLVFFHGWGLDGRFWSPLSERLRGYPQVFFDAGYFGPPIPPALDPGVRWVGVGHSLGFSRALQAPPAGGWAALVSIAGFSRFCATAPGSPGQPRRVVERMLRALAQEPRTALHDFLERCQLADLMPRTDVALHEDRLAEDLALLQTIDTSALLAATPVPLLALAARDDAIVSAPLTEWIFAQRPQTRLVWSAQGGHALGHVESDRCASAITDFLGAL